MYLYSIYIFRPAVQINKMHWNCLLLPLVGLLAVTYAAPDERRKFVRVITEPKPGEEYVSIHTGKPSSGAPAKPLQGKENCLFTS